MLLLSRGPAPHRWPWPYAVAIGVGGLAFIVAGVIIATSGSGVVKLVGGGLMIVGGLS